MGIYGKTVIVQSFEIYPKRKHCAARSWPKVKARLKPKNPNFRYKQCFLANLTCATWHFGCGPYLSTHTLIARTPHWYYPRIQIISSLIQKSTTAVTQPKRSPSHRRPSHTVKSKPSLLFFLFFSLFSTLARRRTLSQTSISDFSPSSS